MRQLAGPHPDATGMELVREHLAAVKAGQSVKVPIYDTTTGDTGTYQEYTPRRFNIVEGEISTYPELRTLIDVAIFIDSDFKTQLAARHRPRRDYHASLAPEGHQHVLASNLATFTIYGAESKQWADIHVFCHEDYLFSLESVRADFLERFNSLVEDATRIDPSGLIVPNHDSLSKGTFLSVNQPSSSTLSFLSGKGVTR